MLRLEGVTKALAASAPSTRCRSSCRRPARGRDRPVRRRQVDAAAHDQPAGRSDRRAASASAIPTSPPCAAARCAHWRARCAMIFQQFNLVGRLDVLTNVLMGRAPCAAHAGAAETLDRRRTRPSRSRRSSSSTSAHLPPSAPTRCPAASSSASRSPARWCRSRRSSWPTSRSPRSIRATPRW